MNDNEQEKTHFGFEPVNVEEKQERVAKVFSSVAPSYDVMNDLMSLGMHRLWKNKAISMGHVRPGHRVLDLACGSGDLAVKLAPMVGETGRVVMSDINEDMLNCGRDRMINAGLIQQIQYVQANAEQLPFADGSFDRIFIGFGLRNVTDKQQALQSMFRVLSPGGCLIILEFSKVSVPLLEKVYDAYSFKVLPWLGEWVAKDKDSYRYLAESIRMHPDQATLLDMMQQADFEKCEYHNVTAGVVAIHRGYKL